MVTRLIIESEVSTGVEKVLTFGFGAKVGKGVGRFGKRANSSTYFMVPRMVRENLTIRIGAFQNIEIGW